MRVVMVAHSFPRTEGDVAGAFLWRFAEALSPASVAERFDGVYLQARGARSSSARVGA